MTRVLLVEDEPAYARLLREVLAEAGTTQSPTWVGSLEDALAQLREDTFDIVLLDLGLPDADGNEALTRVAEAAPATPIVVLSALHDLDFALASMRLGAQEYLVKGQSEIVLVPRAIRYAIERKRMQDIVTAAKAEAERANSVKDEFLAMLGHELRNPLAPIVTAIALMRLRGGTAPIDRELKIVDRQVQHLVRLVDDLLDVSRIARGKLELHRERVDLADVVADGLEIAQSLIETRRHSVSVDVPGGSYVVDGDRSRLGQVLANILMNAAKYTNVGGELEVSAKANGDSVELSVRDNGIGMTPELAEKSFERFQQGARTIDRSAGGLGLGLAIVKSIVELHGGEARVASAGPGLGSEVVVRLPLDTTRAATSEREPSPAAHPADVPRRVLIVDDNHDGAEMLDAGLRRLGHTTRTAHDGRSALETAEDFHPDVALLDIGLPEMDGYELARRMRSQLGDEAPVLVAVTGYGQETDRLRAEAAGFDRHLIKPIDLAAFEELFASLPTK
jgi:signal transduction histidine kinase